MLQLHRVFNITAVRVEVTPSKTLKSHISVAMQLGDLLAFSGRFQEDFVSKSDDASSNRKGLQGDSELTYQIHLSHAKNYGTLHFFWLVNRDPYYGLL